MDRGEEVEEANETAFSRRKKNKFWGHFKCRNSSSPDIQKVPTKNWSSRSLPRLGSVGSLNATATSPSNKPTPVASPIEETFESPEESLPDEDESLAKHEESLPKEGESLPKEDEVKDYFSTLPNEVKLRVLSFLSIKGMARASLVIR
jgi:hypothetical protein